jgi:formyl-CoA transferase
MALDLKREEGLAVFMRLVASADVLVHNFRPSVPVRLGMGYEQLKAVNPRLIYCALTGYGETGPLSNKAGYDQVLQSFTGICTFQGAAQEATAGKPEIVLGSVVDFYAASLLAYGATAALFHRERTGEGQYVGLSLLGAALAMQSGRFIWAGGEDSSASRDLRSGGITGIHPTGEGELYLSANTVNFWRSLCTLVGLPELASNPKYDTVRKRAKCAAEIVPAIRATLKSHTALEWEEIFGDDVPCCAVRPIEEMFDHPQVLAQGLVTTVQHPRLGSYQGLRKPLKFSETPGPEPFAAPTLGQHTDEILASAGYSEQDIGQLRRLGVIPP